MAIRTALIGLFLAVCALESRIVVPTETARLREHFDTVDRELRARDISTLNAQQRATRLTLINWLRDYSDAGMFPQNNRFPDRATPFFRDDRGTLCAMAYLIDRSGRSDMVDRIAQTRNNAYIRELTDDTVLVDWLGDVGLTAAEAGRIQPAYQCGFNNECPLLRKTVDPDYAVASAATGMASLTTSVLSLAKPTRPRGWAAVIAGGVGFILGGVQLDADSPTNKVAAANMIVGTAAMIAGVRALDAAASRAPSAPPSSGKTIDFGFLPPVNALTGTAQRGMIVRLNF